MHLSAVLLSGLPLLTTASPMLPRAGGGPMPKPIPSNCTITNALPHTATECRSASINGWMPRINFTNTHLLYAAYFDVPQTAEELWKTCSEQCYGYGYEGDCKSVILAQDVPTPKGYYGTLGGELLTACLLFGQSITPNDFEMAQVGQWVNETAWSIYCGY